MKELSTQARIELGIDEMMKGKTWAFTAVVGKNGIGLGIAAANEPGYWPIPSFFCNAERYDEMSAFAEKLNREMGLSLEEGFRIVASSMGAGKLKAAPEEGLR